MNAKFIIEQIVMSMSFLKADMFREHKFIKQEDEHGMYKCLKIVINHPETGHLQGITRIATIFDEIKMSHQVNYSYVIEVLSELNARLDVGEHRETIENFYYWMIENQHVPKVDLFVPRVLSSTINWQDSYKLIMGYSNSGNLNKSIFDRHIDGALWNGSKQIELVFEHLQLPKTYLTEGTKISENDARRKYIINSLRSFLFDKETTSSEPKGDSVSNDTQAVQEILNKPIKDKEMKQEQFYTKLYFYSDAKRIVFSDGTIQDIADCFSKLSVVDQADVCNQFGITATSIKDVPGIATVLATMFMNMEMQVLKRKLSDLVSHGFIGELHGRIEQCETWEDVNKLHQYVMATFNGMEVESVKDIIVKHFGLDNHDQFQHDGTQLAGFFAGVIFADAMTMVQRKEEYQHLASHYQPCDVDCPGCSRKKDPLDQVAQPKILASVKETCPEESEFHTLGNALRELLGKTYPSAQQQDENDIMNRQLDKVMGGQYSKDTPHVIVVSYI